MARTWAGRVFIGTSVDGKIARLDGSVDWLETRGAAAGDAGFAEFYAGIDMILMGRGTYEKVRSFPSWPFADKQVLVLSSTLPADTDDRITVVGDLTQAESWIESRQPTAVYIDGGKTICSCLEAGLIDELTISQVPHLLGEGRSLFGTLTAGVELLHQSTNVLEGGMVQSKYAVQHGGGDPS